MWKKNPLKAKIERKIKLWIVVGKLKLGIKIPWESVIKFSPAHKRWFSLQDNENKEKLFSISKLNQGKIWIPLFATENCSKGDIENSVILLKIFILSYLRCNKSKLSK